MNKGGGMQELERIRELKIQGFFCSQIIMLMGLDLQGKSNTELVRAMNSLAGGIGFNGLLCGALSGGAAMLGLYAGKGLPDEEQDWRLDLMLGELVYWFKAEYGERGVNCDDILEGRQENIPLRCPGMAAAVFQKCKELLVENGYNLSGAGDDL
jgi:hypothetical protein